MIEPDLEVDTSGLQCPLPLLRLKKALVGLESGQIIKMITTDPAAHLDFGVYCQQAGHEILEQAKQTERTLFYIKKK